MSINTTDSQKSLAADGDWAHHSFLIGTCTHCDRVVLTTRNLDGEELIDCCMHCDKRVEADEMRWASPQEVVQLGYFIDGYVEDGDSESGCRGGACGVQQP